MRVLELFSGTKSVGKCCTELGWESVSLDNELPAVHEVDIMEFNYKQYPKDKFNIIWASPPCTYYSNLQNCWIGRQKADGVTLTKELLEEKRKESDKLIKKTLEIIEYFNPHYWFIENPQRGQLKDRDVVKDLPYYDVSYCMYSDWGYEKRTRIWTNKKGWNNLICDRSGSCGNMIEKQHNKVCDGGYDKRKKHKKNVSDVHSESHHKQSMPLAKDVSQNYGSGTNRLDRYRIPPDLIYSLFLD